METPSQLEAFLNTHRADGLMVDQERGFTLARDKALLKLADFQLPYSGAWAVKVIQSAVCVADQSGIRVQQTQRETRFGFDFPSAWSLETLEPAFFTPEPAEDSSLNHLMSALWAVGVGKTRGFLLTLPEQTEALLWDGAVMHRLPLEEPRGGSLTVSHRPSDHSVRDWISDPGLSRRLNAEVSTALAERCYTCPVPLILDGRRLDGFHLCPSHGWTGNSFPFYLTFLDSVDGRVRTPRGTFENLTVLEKNDALSPGLHVMSVEALKGVRSRIHCSGFMMVSAHASKAVSRRYSKWETRKAVSTCYWVRDGVVVDRDTVEVPNAACSVAIFLSAQDLKTDISGLALVGSAKIERLRAGVRETGLKLSKVAESVFSTVIREAGRKGKVVGGTFFLLGAGMAFASPVHGFACMGAGFLSWYQGGKEEKQLVATYRQELAKLVRSWPQ